MLCVNRFTMVSIFEDGYKAEDIVFSLNKGVTYMPKQLGPKVGALVVDPQGNCKRECEPKPCECPMGNCPESECWGSPSDCECWDSYAGDFGLCVKGKFCVEGCDDCCNAGRPGMTCLTDYRDNYLNSGDGNVYLEFVEDEACPAAGAVGPLDDSSPPAAPVCCKKGTCRYSRAATDSVGYWYYCLSGVSEAYCKGLKKQQKNLEVTFTCCPAGTATCDCEKEECPSGQPERGCTASEVWTHLEGSFGQVDQCYCRCKSAFNIDTVELGNLCVLCGENSTWDKPSQKCRCKDDYETPSGADGFSLTEFTVDSTGVAPDDHKTATGQPCVPKKYKCDQTKDPPECVYVPVAQRDGIEGDLYDLKTGCEGAGCGKYKCESGECVHNMASNEFPNKQACLESTCRNHKCVNEECVPDPAGTHVGNQACLDAGCGGKWFCSDGAECKQISVANPLPDGATEYDDEAACGQKCGKYFCDAEGSCKQFKNGQEPDPSNTVLFDNETACSQGNCGKYFCDDTPNECKKAGGADVTGRGPYWEGTAEGLDQCYSACTCPEKNPAAAAPVGLAGEFNVAVPGAGSSCKDLEDFLKDLKKACEDKYYICKESEGWQYVECSGGTLGCTRVGGYEVDSTKLSEDVVACRTGLYWDYNHVYGNNEGPTSISDCLKTTRGNAMKMGYKIEKGDEFCEEQEVSVLVAAPQSFTNSQGQEVYYRPPTDFNEYSIMYYKPCNGG